MKLKRIFAVLLAAAVAAAASGCKQLPPEGKNQSEPAASNTEEMKPESGAALKFRTTDVDFAKAAAEKFKEKYGVSVTVEEGGAYDFSKGVLEGASGKGPDVFMSPNDKTLEGIQAGLFLPLDGRIVKTLQEEISPVAVKTVTVDNKVYGVPVSIETNVLFYNKNLVKGEPAATFEQIKKEAASFNNSAQNKFWYLTNVSEGSPIYPMLSTYGFSLFGPNGTDAANPGFDTPEFEKGLEVLHSYHDMMPISSGDLANWDFLTNQFTTGKTAYMVGGPWNVKTFRTAGIPFGVTSIPTYDGHEQKPFAFVQNAHVSAYSKYPQAAQLFAQYLVSPEAASLLYAKAAKITSRSDAEKLQGLKEDEQLTAIAKAFEKAVPMPSVKRISYYWTISANIGPAVFDGKMTPQAAAKKAAQDWKTFLQTE